MKKFSALLALAFVAVVAKAGNASWEITKVDSQAYISDGDWTFKVTLRTDKVKNIDGTSRSGGLYRLVVGACTVYPESVTPLDFSKPLVNSTTDGRTYAISDISTALGKWEKYNSSRNYIATDAGSVAGKLTLPSCDYQFTIGDSAFAKCEHIDFDLSELPDGLITLSDNSFADSDVYGIADCTNLTSIGAHAFAKDQGVMDFHAPKITKINACTFWLTGITNVNLGADSQLTYIGSWAFYNCSNLVSFTPFLPVSCAKVDREAFSCCVKLATPLVYYGGNAGTKMWQISSGKAGVVCDDWGQFYNCQSLPSVDLSNSSIKFLVRQAFNNCYALEWVKLPPDLGSLGLVDGPISQAGPFANCTNLSSVTPFVPNTVTNIGGSTFSNCPKLRGQLKLLGVTGIGGSSINGSGIDSVEFGSQLWSIGDSAFQDCTKLSEIKSPADLRGVVVGKQAFQSCNGLTGEVDFRFAAMFGTQEFYNTKNIKTLLLGDGLTNLVGQTFQNMTGLRNIYWEGDKPETLGANLFQGCTAQAITNFVPKAYAANWQSVVTAGAGTIGRVPVEWRSNTKQWICLSDATASKGLMMILR